MLNRRAVPIFVTGRLAVFGVDSTLRGFDTQPVSSRPRFQMLQRLCHQINLFIRQFREHRK